MTGNLKKAIQAGFYYEAIFIEYAIIEDRCVSALRHAGVKYLDSKGHEIKLSEKVRKLRSNPAFTTTYVRRRITLELLDEIVDWKRDRDLLIHAMAKIPYDHDSVKNVAERGQVLVRNFGNKVKSVNQYYDKQKSTLVPER
jgi:hypothetical protein